MLALLARFIPGAKSAKLIAIAFAVGLGSGGALAYKYAKAAEVDALQKQIKAMQADSKRQNEILVKRERARATAQREARRWEQRWRGRLKTDETCKAWADAPLPGCVADQLFNADQGAEDVPRAPP